MLFYSCRLSMFLVDVVFVVVVFVVVLGVSFVVVDAGIFTVLPSPFFYYHVLPKMHCEKKWKQ